MSNLAAVKSLAFKLLPPSALSYVRKCHYLRVVKNFSDSEEPDLAMVKRLVKSGDLVVDIGANIGVYTSRLSKLVGTAGTVISIEPIPPTYDVLQNTVSRLGFGNCVLVNAALAAATGSAVMEVPIGSSGSENLYRAHIVNTPSGENLAHYKVRVETLDNLLRGEERRVSFIKVDVEGAELGLLQGSHETIKRSKPIWLIEVNDDPDIESNSGNKVFRLLEGAGYKAFWYDGKELRSRQRGESSVNYFFLPDGHEY